MASISESRYPWVRSEASSACHPLLEPRKPCTRSTGSGRADATRVRAAAFGRDVDVDERWIELDYGEFDGRPIGEVPADVWATWRTDPHFAPPGGESLVMLGNRVRGTCEELLDEIRQHDVVVVSHVSP